MNKSILFFATLLIFVGCEQQFDGDSGVKLSFNVDTVNFDTVFANSISSAVRLTVYNSSDKNILVDISAENGDNSNFIFNINGCMSYSVKDVPILKNDSIIIFIQSDIKTSQNEVYEIEHLNFYTGGEKQSVDIKSYALNPVILSGIIVKDSLLNADRVYLIKDSVVVDNNVELTVLKGCKFYFNRDSYLKINGSVKCEGSLDSMILFSSSRLGKNYADIPGQWRGLNFEKNSYDNILNYVEIINARTGILANGIDNNTSLRISGAVIKNHTYAGLVLSNCKCLMYNSLVANCGFNCVLISSGGYYDFYHCTLAEYYKYSYRNGSALSIENIDITNFNALIANSIIYGSSSNEVDFDISYQDKIKFLNCLLRTTITYDNSLVNCVLNPDFKFADIDNNNFILINDSPAIDAGNKEITDTTEYLQKDFFEKSRTTTLPDAGYAEF